MEHLLGKSLARNANEDPKLDRGKHLRPYIAELRFRYDARLTRAFLNGVVLWMEPERQNRCDRQYCRVPSVSRPDGYRSRNEAHRTETIESLYRRGR
jgi:hypothetical protein